MKKITSQNQLDAKVKTLSENEAKSAKGGLSGFAAFLWNSMPFSTKYDVKTGKKASN